MSDGIIGTTMVAHKILPGVKTILRISVGLSDTAKQRSKWIDWLISLFKLLSHNRVLIKYSSLNCFSVSFGPRYSDS